MYLLLCSRYLRIYCVCVCLRTLLSFAEVVGALQRPETASNELLLEKVLTAICCLAGNDTNQARLGEHGACAGGCLLG